MKGKKLIVSIIPIIALVALIVAETGGVTNNRVRTDFDFLSLNIEVTKEGTGDRVAQSGNKVKVDYTGTLKDGTKFDSSKDRNESFEFILGTGAVIKGWEEGLLGMKVGETRLIQIPSNFGYGSLGSGIIPPNAGLIFEVEMLEITD